MSDRHRAELLLAFAIALGISVAYQVRHVLLLIYISAFILAFLVPPTIIRDLEGLAADWPRRAVSLFERLPTAAKLNPAWLEQHLSGTAGSIFLLFKGIAGGLFGFFSWLVLTAYFILDGERAFHWAMFLFPSNRRPRLESKLLPALAWAARWRES